MQPAMLARRGAASGNRRTSSSAARSTQASNAPDAGPAPYARTHARARCLRYMGHMLLRPNAPE
eukprot:306722-Alexandrium_andersonii.AAC.1